MGKVHYCATHGPLAAVAAEFECPDGDCGPYVNGRCLDCGATQPGYFLDELDLRMENKLRGEVARLRPIVRELAAREPRDPGHANKLPRCTLCSASVLESDWEALCARHGWNGMEISLDDTVLPIPHTETCPYRRAVAITRVV